MAVKDVLLSVLNEEKQTMADEFIRMKEILECIQIYYTFNIDELAGQEIEKLSIETLKNVMEKRIKRYEKYVRTDKVGVYALAKK